MLRFVKNFKTIILTRAKKHNALISNTAITVVLMTGADLMQQNFEKDNLNRPLKATGYDLDRSRNITIIGLLTGPLMHGWYTILDTKYTSKAFNIIFKKVAIDQVFGSPLFLIVYFIGLSLLEGQTIRGSCDECKEKFPFAYLVFYFILNFYFCYLYSKYFRSIAAFGYLHNSLTFTIFRAIYEWFSLIQYFFVIMYFYRI